MGLSSQLVPYAIVAASMVVVELYILIQLLPRSNGPPTLTRMLLGCSVLLGSAGLLMALLAEFTNPTYDSYTAILWAFNFMMMGPPGLWIIGVMIYRDRRVDPTGWVWPVTIALLATLAEVLMGVLFSVGAGDLGAVPAVLAASLASIWFLWSMGAAMVALIVWIPLPVAVRSLLVGLAAASFVAPWVTAAPLIGALLMTGVMGTTFLVALLILNSGSLAIGSHWTLSYGVFGGFLAMDLTAIGVAMAPTSMPAILGFGLVVAGTMTLEMTILLREAYVPGSWSVGARRSDRATSAPVNATMWTKTPAWKSVRGEGPAVVAPEGTIESSALQAPPEA